MTASEICLLQRAILNAANAVCQAGHNMHYPLSFQDIREIIDEKIWDTITNEKEPA